MLSFFDSSIFTWIILPILIFCSRIADVSIGTTRIIMIGRGRKLVAAILGFFEVSIWLLVARQVIAHLPNVACFFAYSFGFATGNYVGMWLEEKMATGAQIVRVIMNNDSTQLMSAFQKKGYGVTCLQGQGTQGGVNIIFTIVNRKDMKAVIKLIDDVSPGAFFTVEDVRHCREGLVRPSRWRGMFRFSKRK